MEKDSKKILIITSDKALQEVLRFCFDGWGYEVVCHDFVSQDITLIKHISPDVIVVDVHSANKVQLEICRLLKNDFITAFIPIITLVNKRQLRSQLLNIKQGVDDYLIKPPDPLDLRIRAEMAMRRSQYSFYATPLTGLPGGRIIEETVKDRLKDDEPFSFGYLDIDNFKSFNDTYGYLKGDRAIMQTAYMLYTTVNKFGNRNDFIGHIGGDDFVFITSPDQCKEICTKFVNMFNRLMPFHYSVEDRRRGFIVSKDRTGNIKNTPLMSVSIAIVNRGQSSDLKNVIEINERVAEVKRYLKGFAGSKFMADRRSDKESDYKKPQVYTIKEHLNHLHKPLGQVLLDRKLISREKLDEALTIHWRKGIVLGEILSSLGFIREKELNKILKEVNKSQEGAA